MRLKRTMAGAAITAMATALAMAGDSPPAVKKPRDRTGTVITEPPSPAVQSLKPGAASTKKTGGKDVAKKPSAPPIENGAVGKPVPDGNAKNDAATAPKTSPAPPPIPTEWPQIEIDTAKARCTEVLKGLDAVTIPEPAFRNGDCGAPAAVRLLSIGKSPQVSFSPVPVLTCDMVVALHTWLKRDVQPLARKHLGSEVIKIETMSDYACRNAYGRTKGKLSEHGRANALDIRGFVTAKAVPAYVLENWGPIQREIAAREAAKVAAAKAEAERVAKAAAEAALAAGKTKSATPNDRPSPQAAGKGSLVEGLPATGAKPVSPNGSLGLQPSRLGGPKDKETATTKVKGPARAKAKHGGPEGSGNAESDAKSMVKGAPSVDHAAVFLHETHAAACRIFGTTLGPEANNDHKNHFHIDMAPRKFKKICE